MDIRWFGGALAALVLAAGGAAAQQPTTRPPVAPPPTVRVTDHSLPTRCAEDDNVSIALSGPVRSFAIVAEHPRYLAAAVADRMAPDFTDCDMSADPAHRFEPFSAVLWDDGIVRLVGHRYATAWRPQQVPVRVGGTTTTGLHLVQMFVYLDGAPVEVLVVYPADGYWRTKPLPPVGRDDTGYGTSFLFGPIHDQGRPVVDFATLAIDPVARRFEVAFADGSGGSLAVTADRGRTEVGITLDRPVQAGRPFATLRSMFVTAGNADAARIGWLPAAGEAWSDRPLQPGIPHAADAVAVRLWRVWPSRHNTSAPEIALRDFR